VQVQLMLAGQGRHRAPSIPDIIIAATAELAILHIDKDFELIASITGQPTEGLRTWAFRRLGRLSAGPIGV
jgi:predicted nucleic acid-binding protein